MDTGQIIDLTYRALYIAAVVATPILALCLAVGIFISIFQAATQIHEQSLTFVPKIVVVLIFLAVAGSWMLTQLTDFAKEAFALIANMK